LSLMFNEGAAISDLFPTNMLANYFASKVLCICGFWGWDGCVQSNRWVPCRWGRNCPRFRRRIRTLCRGPRSSFRGAACWDWSRLKWELIYCVCPRRRACTWCGWGRIGWSARPRGSGCGCRWTRPSRSGLWGSFFRRPGSPVLVHSYHDYVAVEFVKFLIILH
jgi:hypothetical protein